jgi:hypothetical protein
MQRGIMLSVPLQYRSALLGLFGPVVLLRHCRAIFACQGRTSEYASERGAGARPSPFTDGASGFRAILSEADRKTPRIAGWFHIAMGLQHARQAASGLSTDTPGRMQAKAVIVPEVERLRRRI